jgi:hypothetical protein
MNKPDSDSREEVVSVHDDVYQHVPHSAKSRVSTPNKLKHKYLFSKT